MFGPIGSPVRSKGIPVAVVVRRRARNVSLLVVVWVLVGLVVAVQRGYITATLLRGIVSAVLAILLWPLVLLGIDLKI
jgi:uncharacterized membrane protein